MERDGDSVVESLVSDDDLGGSMLSWVSFFFKPDSRAKSHSYWSD